MPGWHVFTEPLRQSGKINVLGIIEEQHPERAKLFMQWKKMDWPVYVDQFNLLNVKAVPITILIRPNGIIQAINPSKKFVSQSLNDHAFDSDNQKPPGPGTKVKPEAPEKSIHSYLTGTSNLNHLIREHQFALKQNQIQSDQIGTWHFRLGVAFKIRDESPQRSQGDFSQALDHWEQSLTHVPSQYIWRRRMEQYGPAQTKPYPFYNWVNEAVEAIRARGDEPSIGDIYLTGSELASPGDIQPPAGDSLPVGFDSLPVTPNASVRVVSTMIPGHPIKVPQSAKPVRGPASARRIHVRAELAHPDHITWNNESTPAHLHFPPSNFTTRPVNLRWLHFPNDQAHSSEPRSFDFEMWVPDFSASDHVPQFLDGFLVVNLCDLSTGACYLEKVTVTVKLW